MQILVLKILVNAHNFINKVVRDQVCSKMQTDFRVCSKMQTDFCERLSVLRTGAEITRVKMDVPGRTEGFSESWTTAVPPMKRSWDYTFLSRTKCTTLLTEVIDHFWTAPDLASNLPHPSYQAAPNPSQVTPEVWNHKRSLLVEPRRQKRRKEWQTELSIY